MTLKGGHCLCVCVAGPSRTATVCVCVSQDPQGRPLSSTGFADGHFLLDLAAHVRGGNYTCSLTLAPEVAKCLPSDSPLLTTSASHFVQTTETRVLKLEAELQRLGADTREEGQAGGVNGSLRGQTSAALQGLRPP